MGGCLRVCQKCPFLVSFNFSADFLCTILGLYWTTLGLCSVLFCSALSERVWGGVEQRSLSRYLIAIICVLDQHCWWRDGDWPRWSALPVVCRVKMWSTVEKERYCPGGDHFLKLLLKILTVRCSLSFDDISLRFTFTFCEVEEKHHKNFPVVCRTWSGPECRNMLCKENIFIELSCAWIRGLGK